MKFPKRPTGAGLQGVSAVHGWVAAQQAPAAPKNAPIAIRSVPLTTTGLTHLRAIADSPSAPGEMLNRLGPNAFIGTLYPALLTAQYLKARGMYDKLRARKDAQVDGEWRGVVNLFTTAFAQSGQRGVTERDLDAFAKTLSSNPANLSAVMRIANSAVVVRGPGQVTMEASFVADTSVLAIGDIVRTVIPNLCSQPFAQGSYTKHFHRTFSLTVRVPYPCFDTCHKWGVPYPCHPHWCHYNVTVAGVSFDVDLNVGYKVDCCGAEAWGQASVQACATAAGATACATCTATIVGLAGVARTPLGSNCSYGLGVTASLECKVAGATVFSASVPFGWTIEGPCPPAGFIC